MRASDTLQGITDNLIFILNVYFLIILIQMLVIVTVFCTRKLFFDKIFHNRDMRNNFIFTFPAE